GLPAVHGESAAQKVMRGEGPVEASVGEPRPRLAGELRDEVLLAGLNGEPERFAHVARCRHRFIVALSKGAVEVGVVRVGADAGMPDIADDEAGGAAVLEAVPRST